MATSHLKGGQIQQQEQMEKKGGKRKERQETSGQDIKPLMLCFSTGTGLDESPFVEPFIQQCQTAYFCSSLALLYKQSAIKNPTNVGSLK